MEAAIALVLIPGGAVMSIAVLAGGIIPDFKSERAKKVEGIAVRR